MTLSYQERRKFNDLMGTCMTLNYDSYSIVIHNAQFMSHEQIEFLHSHNLHELYYVLNGKMNMNIDGEEIELAKDDILYISPNVEHSVITDTSLENERFIITFEIINNKCDNCKSTAIEYQIEELINILKDYKKFWIVKDTNDVISLIDCLCDEFLKNVHFYYIKLQGLLSIILVTMIQNILDGNDNGVNEYFEYENRALLMTKYIHYNLQEKITLDKIAEMFHTTPRHVNRIFKKYFNTSFNRTLIEIRLGYAKKYLIDCDHSIEKISELTGFNSVRTLYKEFKENEGISMSEYREKFSRLKV
ncbi:AraC family transcriptional regulator [Alkalibacter mobilis]|uniref:AraC family transcriptional regulator n=1 Tax=Alkalibacter mobilis TaxID=2787712 RepID=UPI00189D8B71|nr:AraC family transcriptional regulator [Alkalibacter mobilis]MBF7095617.1 helix-turn-helix domain-containing protein [Alkalibacter mobilis]